MYYHEAFNLYRSNHSKLNSKDKKKALSKAFMSVKHSKLFGLHKNNYAIHCWNCNIHTLKLQSLTSITYGYMLRFLINTDTLVWSGNALCRTLFQIFVIVTFDDLKKIKISDKELQLNYIRRMYVIFLY